MNQSLLFILFVVQFFFCTNLYATLPENHSYRLADEQSSVSTALAYNIDSISRQVRFDMQMQRFVPAPIQYDFYHRDIPFKEESISSTDKEEYYEKVPLDSMQAARKMAEDSLTNYAFDYLWKGIVKGKIIFSEIVHYRFLFRCTFSKSGAIKSVQGMYGPGNDPNEDIVINYLMDIPRYKKWEQLSSCFEDSVTTIDVFFVF